MICYNTAMNFMQNKFVRYSAYLLFALAVFIVSYWFFSNRHREPELLLSRTQSQMLIEDAEEVHGKENKTRKATVSVKPEGFILGSYEHEQFAKNISDLVIINPVNTIVHLVSDNVNEYDYFLADANDKLVAVLFGKDGNLYVSLTRNRGMKIPNAIFLHNPTLVNLKKVKSISLSPDSRHLLLYGIDSDDKSGVYLMSLPDGQLNFMTDGRSPFWINNKTFVFYKDGEARLLTLNGDKSEILWKSPDQQDAIKLLSLSKDKKHLAVYFPKYNKITLLKLAGNSAQVVGSIDAKAYDILLSPRGRFLAVLKKIHAHKKTLNKIVIYKLDTDGAKELDLQVSNSGLFDFAYSDDFKLIDWYE